MAALKIAAICGSYRRDSWNRKLMRLALRELSKAGVEADVVDLKELALPVYDQDLEDANGLPPPAQELKARLSAAAGLLVVTPEYNSSIPGGLKNAIDWASRPHGNPFKDKVICVCACSEGAFGAVRSGLVTRNILSHLGGWVSPATMTLPRVDKALDAAGEFTEEWMKKEMSATMARFVEGLRAFSPR